MRAALNPRGEVWRVRAVGRVRSLEARRGDDTASRGGGRAWRAV